MSSVFKCALLLMAAVVWKRTSKRNFAFVPGAEGEGGKRQIKVPNSAPPSARLSFPEVLPPAVPSFISLQPPSAEEEREEEATGNMTFSRSFPPPPRFAFVRASSPALPGRAI